MRAGLERATRGAPRPVYFTLLSDHGQSQGQTFKQRFGKTLQEVVEELIGEDMQVMAILDSQEAVGNINMALTEAVSGDTRTSKLGHRVLKRTMDNGKVHLGEYRDKDHAVETSASQGISDVVVLASGNLGLISFPGVDHRLTMEEMASEYPGLLHGLVEHPGIAFVLVNSEVDGWVVLGYDGIYFLDEDRFTGTNPLADFGPNAAEHLRRANGFPNAPDIYVNSMFDPLTEEVAAFEELVGNHGGLGGPQQRPFILHPRGFETGDQPIIGAASVCALFKSWIETVQGPFAEPVAAPETGRQETVVPAG
jgi:hypothetical protein